VKRRPMVAAALGVVLLLAVALAYEWLWHCKSCNYQGTAFYTCAGDGVFSATAYGTSERAGPPDRLCPGCGQRYSADSAVCSGPSPHRYYYPGWVNY